MEETKGYIRLDWEFIPGKSTGEFTDVELGQMVKKYGYSQKEPTIQEAIEVLCNALREDKSEGSLYQDWCYKAAIAFKAEWEKVENNTNIKNASDYKAIISHQAAKNFLNLFIKK